MEEEKGIKLLKNTVVFKKMDDDITDDTKTAGGLYIPKAVSEARAARAFRKGEVVSFGIECNHVKAGDIIFYANGTQSVAMLDGEELNMISEDQIFAIK